MGNFDEKAKTWDSNPSNLERSEAIAKKILRNIKLHTGLTALEFGAGTGILSFLLKDYLKEITLMDSSIEMVKVMNDKIQNGHIDHLIPLFFDLEEAEYRSATFDLIFTQMALHHVTDVKLVLTKFYKLLNAGGTLAIADLYLEDGTFHDYEFNGHLGFDVENLSQILSNVGFKDISHENCFLMKKVIKTNELKEFPIFLLTAKK
jgi:ubiquinone/menaquinone biosynthesis C-methylase UbiE